MILVKLLSWLTWNHARFGLIKRKIGIKYSLCCYREWKKEDHEFEDKNFVSIVKPIKEGFTSHSGKPKKNTWSLSNIREVRVLRLLVVVIIMFIAYTTSILNLLFITTISPPNPNILTFLELRLCIYLGSRLDWWKTNSAIKHTS